MNNACPRPNMQAGGLGAPSLATDTVQRHVNGVRGDLWNALLAKAVVLPGDQQFIAVSFVCQVVAGTNYFVKVKAGNKFVHARIFVGLGDAAPELVSITTAGVDAQTPLDYF